MSWLTDFFRRRYVLQAQSCTGCAAHRLHIEDLQQLLKSERDGYVVLQSMLFDKAGLRSQVQSSEVEAEMKPLRNIQTTSQLRRQIERKEHAEHPDAQKEYWSRVQAEYDRVGKLPDSAKDKTELEVTDEVEV